VVQELIDRSRQGLTLDEGGPFPTASAADGLAADEYIRSHNDHSSYHLLFCLKRNFPQRYGDLPESLKADILCDYLSHAKHFNDWGYLAPKEPYDGEAAQALLATGRTALPNLEHLLEDRRSAPLFGSEEASLYNLYQYRRADFAYRYICLLLHFPPAFARSPTERDVKIQHMQSTLRDRKDNP
jgi:hypothetical protein